MKRRIEGRGSQRGASLVVVAFSLIALLGMTGLAIDLVWLYVGRGEAQRAADGAALAGATAFATFGCTSMATGCVAGSVYEALARQRAIDFGMQNQVAGQNPSINASDVTFAYPTPRNPTITVTVARDTAHGNPMPTFFMKVFGITSVNISAAATAEAFNPTGSGVNTGAKCVKPWLLPNCDWNVMLPPGDPNANPNCVDSTTGMQASYYVNNGAIVQPGAVGQLTMVKPGDPDQAPAPSKFYPINLPPGALTFSCPACAAAYGSPGVGTPSGSLYRFNIMCCNQNTVTCGTHLAEPITGNKVGPTAQGVDCLIHQQANNGQDTYDPNTGKITGGANNPYGFAGTTDIAFSDSVATIPLYNGSALCPGMQGANCPNTNVDVVGFMQIFIKEHANPQGTVYAYIMNITTCAQGGSGGGGGGGTVTSGGSSPIPIRLIRKP